VQVGSRFVASVESSAHPAFKQRVVDAKDGETVLTLKELAPVRLLKNEFYNQVQAAYARGATPEELRELLGRGRAKKGMFEGDLVEGELEIGQVSATIDRVMPVAEIVKELIAEYEAVRKALPSINLL
jgi:enoyl-[acyl-carrier protein] reductase II